MSSSLQSYGLGPSRPLCPSEFSKQEHWSGLPCPPPVDLPDPGMEPTSLMSLSLADMEFIIYLCLLPVCFQNKVWFLFLQNTFDSRKILQTMPHLSITHFVEGGGVLFSLWRREMKPRNNWDLCFETRWEKEKCLSKMIAVFMMIIDVTVGVKHTLSTPQSLGSDSQP